MVSFNLIAPKGAERDAPLSSVLLGPLGKLVSGLSGSGCLTEAAEGQLQVRHTRSCKHMLRYSVL